MRTIIGLALFFIICGLAYYVGLAFIGTYVYNSTVKNYHQHLGDTVYIKGDTSVIVDYNLLKDSYTLSNGKEISTKLIKTQ